MKEFDAIIGYEDEKLELERICDIMRNPEKYHKLGVKTPRGLLIDGVPGTGKTLMAKCLIKASGRKAFTIRKTMPNGDFVTEIKRVFDEAKASAPSIVFLDDMDKYANEDRIHINAEEFVTIQSCLDDCKDVEVFALATTNDTACIPDSLLRAGRFDKSIDVVPPKYKDAVKIIKFYLSQKNFVAELDVEEIAKILDGKSCAELETVINEAGVYAGFAGKDKIDMDDMIKACLRVIFDSPEAVNCEGDFVEEVAYHEAGHTVVHEILEPGTINLVSVASYNGSIGGITSYFQDKNYFKSKKYMENRVTSILGGRSATELVYGTVDVGANSDLHRAFNIVERFVDNYCSFGFDTFEGSNSGPDLLNRKDLAMAREMEKYSRESKRILIENREFLDAVAKALVEKKTLRHKDIVAIKEKLVKEAA